MPYSTTRRAKQMYIAAVKKTGAIVKGTRYLKMWLVCLLLPRVVSKWPWRKNSHDKIIKVERIVMEHNPSYIANHFENQATYHCNHVPPRLKTDTKHQLRDHEESENGKIDGIAGQSGVIFHLGFAKGASGEGAISRGVVRAGRHNGLKKEEEKEQDSPNERLSSEMPTVQRRLNGQRTGDIYTGSDIR